nr:hypothetical protein B0A51_00633 [Rachicladosporium sp. CCFEE 5018]
MFETVKMGIPYSRQINSAFSSVQPLVAAGFETLQTTKNISLLLAFIQVLTALLLMLILLALIGLLVTMNPELDAERKALVTPALKWGTRLFMPGAEGRRGVLAGLIVALGGLGLVGWMVYGYVTDVQDVVAEGYVEKDGAAQTEEGGDAKEAEEAK